jgi:hypothetical protein
VSQGLVVLKDGARIMRSERWLDGGLMTHPCDYGVFAELFSGEVVIFESALA